jgi:polyisoprenoid-binding protein YceI
MEYFDLMRVFALCFAAALAPHLAAAETTIQFEPAGTEVKFSLATALHTVHGTFTLKSGEVTFDPATGKASGELIIDAGSGHSGSDSRDSRMNKSILESSKFTTVVFVPDHVEGAIAPQGSSKVQVHGTMKLHGVDHELTLPVDVQMIDGQVTAISHFAIPYVKWGLKNPSMLFLKVNENVEIDIKGNARVGTGSHP